MNFKEFFLFVLIIVSVAVSTSISADALVKPVAMISDVEGKVVFENSTDRTIDFGTDIFLGDMIKTDKGARVSISFYNGCRQEIIDQNSRVKIGAIESVIKIGKFKSIEQLDCEIPKAVLIETDSHLKAGLVFRGAKSKNEDLIIPDSILEYTNFKIKLWSNKDKSSTYRIGDIIKVYLVANQDVYIRLSFFGSEGDFFDISNDLKIPNKMAKKGKLYSFGSQNEFIANSPTGIDFIHVLASNKPIFLGTEYERYDDYIQDAKKMIEKNKKSANVSLFSESKIKLLINN